MFLNIIVRTAAQSIFCQLLKVAQYLFVQKIFAEHLLGASTGLDTEILALNIFCTARREKMSLLQEKCSYKTAKTFLFNLGEKPEVGLQGVTCDFVQVRFWP